MVEIGDPAPIGDIICELDHTLKVLKGVGAIGGEELLLINGPVSPPVAMVLALHLGLLAETLGVFAPELAGYLIVKADPSKYRVGQVIPA